MRKSRDHIEKKKSNAKPSKCKVFFMVYKKRNMRMMTIIIVQGIIGLLTKAKILSNNCPH